MAVKRFTTFVVGPLTLIENEKFDTVDVLLNGQLAIMTKADFHDLCDLRYSVKFKEAPKYADLPDAEEAECAATEVTA